MQMVAKCERGEWRTDEREVVRWGLGALKSWVAQDGVWSEDMSLGDTAE